MTDHMSPLSQTNGSLCVYLHIPGPFFHSVVHVTVKLEDRVIID